MYIILLFILSIAFSSFSYLLTPLQSILLMTVSGAVLIYIITVWISKNKLRINTNLFLLFALIIAVSQLFYEVNLLFVYYNIWTMISTVVLFFFYRLLNKEEGPEIPEVEVEVQKRGDDSTPDFTQNSDQTSSNIYEGEFVEIVDKNLSEYEEELSNIKNDYEKSKLKFEEILELDYSQETASVMLYRLRDKISEKEKEIDSLLESLEDLFLFMTHYKDENLKLTDNIEQLSEDRDFYMEEALSIEENYIREKEKADKNRAELLKYKDKNNGLIELIDEKNKSNIEIIKNQRKEIQKRWNIIFSSFEFRSTIFRDVSKFPPRDIFYIEKELYKLSFSEDPKELSLGIYENTKGGTDLEHMGVEQTDVPYRIVYTIVNKGKIRVRIEDIFKHSEKKFS